MINFTNLVKKYNIYGSPDSLDLNIMIYVDNIIESKNNIKEYLEELSLTFTILGYPKKDISINLGILDSGIIVDTLYGLPEEMNNVIFDTYQYHYFGKNMSQAHMLAISHKVKLNIATKLKSSIDNILIQLNDTDRELNIKELNSYSEKITFLRKFNMYQEIEFGYKIKENIKVFDLIYKSDPYKEFYNVLATVSSQSILMEANIDHYTKIDILNNLPEMRVFIERMDYDDDNIRDLREIKNEFLDICNKFI